MNDIKPIETQYKGYRMRSRLEARWAVFFDAIGLKWDYEIEGFDLGDPLGWYMPDFYLSAWDMYVEIKPKIPYGEFEKTKEGDSMVMFTQGENRTPTSLGKLIASYEMLSQVKNNNLSEKMVMLCGTPGLPVIDTRLDGWTLRDGSVALRPIYHPSVGFSGIAVDAFAFVGGHKELDIWPYYSKNLTFDGNISVPGIAEKPLRLLSLILPNGYMKKFAYLAGVSYDHPQLLKAYSAARSARFEHGESGAPRI